MISINRIMQDPRGDLELEVRADYRELRKMFPDGNIDAAKLLGPVYKKQPKVERVISNGPATIVFWDDGEKTVVKCRECSDGKCIHDDGVAIEDLPDFAQQVCASLDNISRCIVCAKRFDPEKAVMAAMLKRLYKNYQDVLREAFEGDGDE